MASFFSSAEKLPLLAVAGSILINYLFYWLKTFVFFLIPYILIHIFSKTVANLFYIFFAIVLLLLQVALIQYFNKSMAPLGADIFAYSMADIRQTLGASGGVSILRIVSFIFLIAFSLFVFIYFSKK
jgi:uncharacterized sulfatase